MREVLQNDQDLTFTDDTQNVNIANIFFCGKFPLYNTFIVANC